MANKITVTSAGTVVNANVTPDSAMYYSNKSKEWAISDKLIDNEDYSSKYYANESKKQADISTTKATEVITSGNTAVSNIENARDNAIINVNTAGATQVALATEQATIATNKTSEVVESGNTALSNIDTAKDNAITSITNQETTSKTSLIDEGATQIGLIQNEGATQVANVQSTGFYMRDDKLYFINSQGEETEFKSGGSGLEVCDIGMSLFVDETKGLRRYINGQIVDRNTNTEEFFTRLQKITTLHPSLLDTEENWQAAKTLSPFGQVGKFVFNYNGENIVSVRLPRVVNVQGLFDLQNLGMTVSAGLPNITGSLNVNADRNIFNGSQWGAFYRDGSGGRTWAAIESNSPNSLGDIHFDASRSNPIYGNSNTVQPEAIQYPYFIQIATGSETENNIINDIELNNPYSLFDSKYSDHELNNLSWLKSEGQWNAKSVYTDAYDKLLKVYNGTETVEGLSVKLSTETYTDYDFVLNTAEETFRLPLLNGEENLPTGAIINQPIPSKGDSFYDISYNCFVTIRVQDCTHCRLWDNTQNRETWTTGSAGWQGKTLFMPKGHQLGVFYQNGTMTRFTFQKAQGNGTLYYYVGETVQNANLIDAGRIGEQLATKTDMQQAAKAGMPSNRYIDLTLGASGTTYTAPADGWFIFRAQSTGVANTYIDTVVKYRNQPISTATYIVSFTGDTCGFVQQAPKGAILTFVYNTTFGPITAFRFVYAKGSEPTV